MAGKKTDSSPDNYLVYSVQRTYILTDVTRSEKRIITCDQRIDIPTIEPLNVQPALFNHETLTVIPCIELAGEFLSEFNLTFETNEGVTVLPVKIGMAHSNSIENPYMTPRFVLVLPRGATGVKSCKITLKGDGQEVQHNFTFGIMPPPYNYDNALFGCISHRAQANSDKIDNLEDKVAALETKTDKLKIVTQQFKVSFPYKNLPKGSGKQTINIAKGMIEFGTNFIYSALSSTVHSPKITVSDGITTKQYTLSLDRSVRVIIDLLAATLTAYVTATGEIVQQRKIFETVGGYKTIDYEDFDDILGNELTVLIGGRSVE